MDRKLLTDFRHPYFQGMAAIGLMLTITGGCQLAARNHNVQGVASYQSGQISQAINEFQQALVQNPQDAEAYYNLGASYYALGKQSNNQQWIQQAEQLYRQSIALNERQVAPHRGLAALLVETGRQRQAFDLLNTWQRRNPNMSDPLVEIARLHQEHGDINRAGDYLADALRIDSNNPRVLKAMGYVREQQGQYALALENYTRSYQQDSRQGDLADQIARLQTQVRMAGANQPLNQLQTPRF